MEIFLGSLLFAVIGLAGLIWSIAIISRSIDSEEWTTVDCEIRESHVEEIVGESIEYRARIRYTYFFDGLSYEGNTVRFGKSSVWKSTAQRICRNYPSGSRTRVRVDPKRPERSVLISGISPGVYVMLIIFMVFFVIGTKLLIDVITW